MFAKGISSYQNASLTLRDSRSQEAEVLTRLTAAMERASQAPVNARDFHEALSRNQRVWNEFVVALTQENHPYPIELRARLISLAIWVNKHTHHCLRVRRDVEPLILLNRDIIAGLQATQVENKLQNDTVAESKSTFDTQESREAFHELHY